MHRDDLPDDMVFDPLTETVVFKNTLHDRPSNTASSPGLSSTKRKKLFLFPKNATVAEVIEHGMEQFGLIDGIVDGGDEVEDKLAKHRSSTRVRYCLAVDIAGKGVLHDIEIKRLDDHCPAERELPPTSRVIDAFPRPPTYRAMDLDRPRQA